VRTLIPVAQLQAFIELDPSQQLEFAHGLTPKEAESFREQLEAHIVDVQSAGEMIDRYALNPDGFIREVLDEHPWSKQVEILESVRDYQRTIVPASFGVGKSFIAARTVAWFVSTRPHPLVLTSAPSFNQVKNILWRELGRAHREGNLMGKCNMTDWVTADGEVVAFGRKPADHDADATFQGIHSLNFLIVLDEAGGIPAGLWDGAKKLMTNKNSRLLAIGNPDEEGSIFHQNTEDDRYNTITISAYDTPAFTGEQVPQNVLDELVTKEWVEDVKIDFGEDSATFSRRVLAKFVKDAKDGVVLRSHALACQRHDLPAVGSVTCGLDVGAGGDHTVLIFRQGPKVIAVHSFRENDPQKQAHRCNDLLKAMETKMVLIDRIGVGHHLVGHIRDLNNKIQVKGVSVSEKASNKERFLNRRAEMWWHAREQCRDLQWDLSELDQDAIEELVAPKYSTNKLGKIQVESKKDIIARLGRSTDFADALLLAFHHDKTRKTEVPSTNRHRKRRQNRMGGPGTVGTPIG